MCIPTEQSYSRVSESRIFEALYILDLELHVCNATIQAHKEFDIPMI